MTESEKKALNLLKDSMDKKCTGLNCKVVENNISLRRENIKLNKLVNILSEKLAKAYHYNVGECSLKTKENIMCDNYTNCTDCVKNYYKERWINNEGNKN